MREEEDESNHKLTSLTKSLPKHLSLTKSLNDLTVKENDTLTASECDLTGRTMTSMFPNSSRRSLYSSESLTRKPAPESEVRLTALDSLVNSIVLERWVRTHDQIRPGYCLNVKAYFLRKNYVR